MMTPFCNDKQHPLPHLSTASLAKNGFFLEAEASSSPLFGCDVSCGSKGFYDQSVGMFTFPLWAVLQLLEQHEDMLGQLAAAASKEDLWFQL